MGFKEEKVTGKHLARRPPAWQDEPWAHPRTPQQYPGMALGVTRSKHFLFGLSQSEEHYNLVLGPQTHLLGSPACPQDSPGCKPRLSCGQGGPFPGEDTAETGHHVYLHSTVQLAVPATAARGAARLLCTTGPAPKAMETCPKFQRRLCNPTEKNQV